MSYSPEERAQILADLVEAISGGTPLAEFAREVGVSRGTLYNWLNDDDLVSAHIARARAVGYDALAAEVLDLIDGCGTDKDSIAKAKAQAWARLQLLAKWHSSRYGDKQHVTHAGDATQPITIVTGVPQPRAAAEDDVDISMFE